MRNKSLLRALLACILVTGATWAVSAAPPPLTSVELPDPLKSWVPWVLDDAPQAGCPHVFNDANERTCAWPGALLFKASASGASFSQSWQVVRDAWVPLPGDAKHWPQSVTVDEKLSPVLDRSGTPSIRLRPGTRRVAGTFSWAALPESVALPTQTGMVQLELDHSAVAEPMRDDQRLWLQRQVSSEGDEQTQVQVNRRVIDGVPLKVETRLRLEVSGKNRELVVRHLLLPDMIPLDLVSPLPATLAQNGSLKIQARAGTWDVVLTARHPGAATTLSLPAKGEGLLAPKEVWAFEAMPMVRSVSIQGPPPVDPQQTTLPQAWRELPAYLMHPGAQFGFKELRRGDADPAPNTLDLQRQLWLSFDGTTLTLRDRITGQVNQSSRLEMAAPVQLGRVDFSERDQLITRGAESLSGVELNRGKLTLTADSLVPNASRQLPVTGWLHSFNKVSINLALPAGWQLLYASGADLGQGAWLSRWNLLDLFVTLITTLAVGRLWGRRWGILAFVLLVVCYHEPGAPRYAWLAVLGANALARVIPVGPWRNAAVWLERASLLTLILISLNFAVVQVRSALFPVLAYQSLEPIAQLTDDANTFTTPGMEEGVVTPLKAEVMRSQAASPDRYEALDIKQQLDKRYAADKPARGKQDELVVDPKAMVQTGPGLPETRSQYHLSWDGPVQPNQRLDLWLLPPWGHQMLVILRVALLSGLLACLVRAPLPHWLQSGTSRHDGQPASSTLTGLLMLCLAVALVSAPGSVQAQIPDNTLLEALKEKLTRPADCLPACATISRLSVQAAGSTLVLGLEVDAAVETAVPLPGGTKYWIPREARINQQTAFVQRAPDGGLWMLVPSGTHRIELRGDLAARSTLQLPLPLKPRQVQVSAVDWDVAGLSDDGSVADTFQLTRRKARTEDPRVSDVPVFLRVERRLIIGLAWRVQTTVHRESPLGVPVLAQVPLLPGEAVTTSGIDVRDGRVLVNLAPQAGALTWTSTLPQTPTLSLTAPTDTTWTEKWMIDATTLWRIKTEGLPPLAAVSGRDTGLTFMPWPGEKLTLQIEQPQAVPGQTLTVDSSHLTVSPGSRASDYHLRMVVRSSLGQDHAIKLPEQASLQRISINGQVRPIRANGRQLLLPIVPGKQTVEITWQMSQGMHFQYATQHVDLGIPSVNGRVALQVPHERWLLMAGGPGIGPAILFWGALLVMLGMAVLLGFAKSLPLKVWQWMLLAVGLTQVPWWGAAATVGWFFAMSLRRQHPLANAVPWRFNLQQVGLVALTLVMLFTLLTAVVGGLLGQPDMQVVGNGSNARMLYWYIDRAAPQLPAAWALTLPMLIYQGLMLAWALWLAWSLLVWLKWGWQALSEGQLWRHMPKVQVPENF